MRRRLDLAAALVARPTVLFLDEPTTGLDPQSRNDLWEVIESLVDVGTTVLLTTQYLEEADRLASTLAVLDHGRVIAEGTPASMKADLGATVLEVGLANLEDARRTGAVLDSLGPHAALVNGTVAEVTVDNGPQAAMLGLRALDAQGVVPTTFRLREPSLDDVFLSLTGHRTEEEATEESDDAEGGRSRRRMRSAERAMPVVTGELS
jgi:ABC-2 type transport system ATP-binding protein